MSNNFRLTGRMMTALEEPIEPQTAWNPDIVENVADKDEQDKFTSIATTQQIIRNKIDKASSIKYSETKAKLFPNAERLNEIRTCLQKTTPDVEHATKLGMSQEKYGNWKHSTRMNFELVDDNVHRTGAKAGYLVPLEKIHKVLVWAHNATDHGGRDATYEFLKQRYSVDNITKAFVTEWVASCPHEKHHKGKRRQEPVFAAAPANAFPGPLPVAANPLLVHAPAVPVVDNLVEEAPAATLRTTGDEGYASEAAVDGDKPMEDLFDFESASSEGPSDEDILAPIVEWNKCH